MEKHNARWMVGVLAMTAGLALLFGGEAGDHAAEAQPVPYTRLTFPQNDGGIFICPPPKFGPIAVTSGLTGTRTSLIQVREGEGAVRVGGPRTSAISGFKKGIQLKSRESVSWDVGTGGPAYCVAEADSDAGSIVDVVFGVMGP